MKTLKLNLNGFNFEILILIAFILGIFAGKAHAQGYKTGTKSFYLGFEGTVATRHFHLTSDLQNWNGINTLQRGGTLGLVAGNNLLVSRIKLGSFKSDNGLKDAPIKLTTIEIGTNFYPLQVIVKKNRYFEPYLITSFDQASIKLSGTWVPPAANAPGTNGSSSNQCTCTCPNMPPSAPPPPPVLPNDPVAYAGKVNTVRMNVGVGIQVHAPRPNNFLNLFAEIKYGQPLGQHNTTQALLNTKASSQMAVEFGLVIGISSNKNFGYYKFKRRRW